MIIVVYIFAQQVVQLQIRSCLNDLEETAALGGNWSREHSRHRTRIVRMCAAHYLDLLWTLVFTANKSVSSCYSGLWLLNLRSFYHNVVLHRQRFQSWLLDRWFVHFCVDRSRLLNFIVNLCGESGQLVVHLNFAKNSWAQRSEKARSKASRQKSKLKIIRRKALLRDF